MPIKPDQKLEDIWLSEHAATLKHFLQSPAGEAFRDVLDFFKPAFARSNDPNALARAACQREGFEAAVNLIHRMTLPDFRHTGVQDPESYPDLDDDTKWSPTNQPLT